MCISEEWKQGYIKYLNLVSSNVISISAITDAARTYEKDIKVKGQVNLEPQ